MKQKVTYQGRSLFFNFLFVFINLVGISSIVIGFQPFFNVYKLLFLLLGFGLMSLSIFGLIIFKGRLLMSSVARVIVGSICIISGLVKANDPLGFSYKLEEYFEDGALAYRIKEIFNVPSFSIEYLINYALIISVVICVLEIVLGVLLIIGGRVKIVSYLTLLMMLFFTFLTLHTANCDSKSKFLDEDSYSLSSELGQLKLSESKTNKNIKIVSKLNNQIIVHEMKQPQCVTDCGCFGDALKGSVGRSLTPSESLWKDIVLVYLVIWVFISQWKIKPNTWKNNLWFLSISMILVSLFSWVFGWYFPILFSLIVLLAALWMKQVGGKYLGNSFGSSLIVILLSTIFVSYVLYYEPLKDYRPYAVGNNILQKMYDGIEGKYKSMLTYKNKNTGDQKIFDASSNEYSSSKIWELKNWVNIGVENIPIVEPRQPSITDQFDPFISKEDISTAELTIPLVRRIVELDNKEDSDISLRNYIVHEKKIVVLVSKQLNKSNWSSIERIKSIFQECKNNSIPFILITNSSRSAINAFRIKFGFNVPTFINDEIELKAISRSNPALLIIKNAVIKGKYPHRSIPKYEWLSKNILFKK